jgi:hypothetical protein
MKLHRFAIMICASVLLLDSPSLIPVVRAQEPGQPPASKEKARPNATSPMTAGEPSAKVKAVTQAILDEIDKNSELMANIEYLCDMIGPRLTGLDQGQPLDAGQVQAVRAGECPTRALDDPPGLDSW